MCRTRFSLVHGRWKSLAIFTPAHCQPGLRLVWKMSQRDHLEEIYDLSVPAVVDLLRGWFSLNTLTTKTRRALEDYLYAERATEEWPQYRNVLTLVMLSPEMQLA